MAEERSIQVEKTKFRKLPVFTHNSRMNLELRKMSTCRQIYRTPFPSQKRKPPAHYKFHFDEEVKGWRERDKVSAATRWNKAKGAVRVGNYFIGIRKKPDTVLNIDVKKVVAATKANREQQLTYRQMAGKGDEEIEESLVKTLTEPSVIQKPFTRPAGNTEQCAWSCPAFEKNITERAKSAFDWSRPKAERKQLVDSASRYQAIYLQGLLKEKDKEIRLITNQLLKANKENVSLLKELEGGKNYDELYKENVTLKEQIARACRENVALAGQRHKERNRVLQKFEKARTLS
ncbi:uncharacterized protein LOC127856556 isoform X2 [Dreissena polymorpha]|uniref:uncharacterized protein LOC127856556 isoform X2 n=1 Tax=Dreissena polymorpha TaxID=45954 RepID=UPI002264FAF2|nr:uncharacterized protein LOC127856556 isoform X2 [Dreissena polymorpha]